LDQDGAAFGFHRAPSVMTFNGRNLNKIPRLVGVSW
jgi:hypothetical protein